MTVRLDLDPNKRICKWCGKEIEGKGWKDGPNTYCNFQCFSAKTWWQMLGLALFMTPIIAAITTPWMRGVFLEEWRILGPFWSLVGYYVFILVAFLALLFFYYVAYVGWRVRTREKELHTPDYPVDEFRTYDQ